MTRIEAIINSLNKEIGAVTTVKNDFKTYNVCTVVNNNDSTPSFVWDILASDWIFYETGKPILYHVIDREDIETIGINELETTYKITTTILFNRTAESSDSQIAEWYKKRFIEFNNKRQKLNTYINGFFSIELNAINYNGKKNYSTDFPNTNETYVANIGCIKIEWICTLSYNVCATIPACEAENYCFAPPAIIIPSSCPVFTNASFVGDIPPNGNNEYPDGTTFTFSINYTGDITGWSLGYLDMFSNTPVEFIMNAPNMTFNYAGYNTGNNTMLLRAISPDFVCADSVQFSLDYIVV